MSNKHFLGLCPLLNNFRLVTHICRSSYLWWHDIFNKGSCFAEMLAWLPGTGVNELRLLIKIDLTRTLTSYECSPVRY